MNHGLLCLSETWTENSVEVRITNMMLVAQNKRMGRTGKVAIYQRINATITITRQEQPTLSPSDVGDLCVVQASLNNISILMLDDDSGFPQIRYSRLLVSSSCRPAARHNMQ